MKLQKLKDEYKSKLNDMDKTIVEEKRFRSLARKSGDLDSEIAIRSADIAGLQKARQVYVQILHDLDDFSDENKRNEPPHLETKTMNDGITGDEQSRVAADCPNGRLIMCGRCKDCTHWVGEEHLGMKTCRHEYILTGYGQNPEDVGPSGLIVEDDEGWAWCTGPEFGCVHFKQSNA